MDAPSAESGRDWRGLDPSPLQGQETAGPRGSARAWMRDLWGGGGGCTPLQLGSGRVPGPSPGKNQETSGRPRWAQRTPPPPTELDALSYQRIRKEGLWTREGAPGVVQIKLFQL
jgi:hypothetical protein